MRLLSGIMIVMLVAAIPAGSQEKEVAATPAGSQEKEAGQPIRTWTAATGATVDAKFIKMDGQKAVLQREDGTVLDILMQGLSPADQEYIKKLVPGAGKVPDDVVSMVVAPSTSPDHLDTYAEGKWKGMNAVYECPTFYATVDGKGQILIQPLDSERNPVGKPIRAGGHCYYHDAKEKITRGRAIVKFDQAPKPTLKPKRIEMTGVLKDDVEFELQYEFKGNTIILTGESEDPKDIEYPSTYRVHFSAQRAMTFPRTMKVSEQAKKLEGWTMRIKLTEDRKPKEYEFYRSMNLGESTEECEVVGPWGPREIEFEGKSKAGCPNMHVWNYSGNALYQGYAAGRTASQNQKTGPIKIKIE